MALDGTFESGKTDRAVTAKPIAVGCRKPVRRHPAIDADELVAAALRKEGRREFRDLSFFGPLERLVVSLNEEADLNAFGRRAARFDAIRCLTNLLRFESVEGRAPDILSRQIRRPIFISGFPRSTTTFLHELLARDPRMAVPRSWQIIYPYPLRPRYFLADLRRAAVTAQLGMFRLCAPEVHKLHPLTADGPQECTDITAHIFQSLRYDTMYHVPSYQRWLERNGHLDAYRFHRRFLQHLNGPASGRQWVVKSPDHMYALDTIRKVYPDAGFIMLHRDPLEVLTSQLNLSVALRRPFARHLDLKEIGRSVSNAIADLADRLIAARDDADVLHLGYRTVASNPAEAISRIYRRVGMSLTPEAAHGYERWLARQRRVKSRRHRRSLSDFGLSAEGLAERFSDYRAAFEGLVGHAPADNAA